MGSATTSVSFIINLFKGKRSDGIHLRILEMYKIFNIETQYLIQVHVQYNCK